MKSRQYCLLLVLSLFTLCAAASPETVTANELKELYRQIDDAISNSDVYVKAHRDRIDEVRNSYKNAQSAERRMMYADQMYLLYKSFDNDSALAYIREYIDLADQTGQKWAADRGRSLMAYQYSSAGLYSESLEILKDMDGSSMQPEVFVEYLNARVHVYNELAYYTPLQDVRDIYYGRRDLYRDSLYRVADPGSAIYLQLRESELLDSHRFDEALEINDNWMALTKAESRDYAIVCYYRYLIYATMHDEPWSRYWLAKSALSDIRHAVMDQASLISLSELLNQDGDFERSYRYISFTWRSNNSFNTRMRSWQISPILTVIETDYQTQKKRGERFLLWMMLSAILLALVTLSALLFSLRERRKLSQARSQLQISNNQLTQLNEKLTDQTQELTDLNGKLSLLNSQLSDANWVKEEYIGHFLSLCSNYVDRMDDYRKMINRKLKNREFEELAGLTRSAEFKDREVEDLYDNFDRVFLRLFPDFVQEFNALLKPEEQIIVKQSDKLTIDLRIFALIRLGIEDSSKIAELLHYSVNTIYAYRARIKNGAAGNRDEFENEVRKIGKLT